MRRACTLLVVAGAFPAFLLVSSQLARAADHFNDYFYDVESPKVSQPIQQKAEAVASMGVGSGVFQYPVSANFFDQSVKFVGSDGKIIDTTTMNQAFTDVTGSASLYGDGKQSFIQLSYPFAYLIPYIRAAQKSSAVAAWVPSADGISAGPQDGRNLPENSLCTGFLIGPNYVMTNNHCVSTQEMCSAISFRFDYQMAKDLITLEPLDGYSCKKLIMTDSELDFSVVQVEGNPSAKYPVLSLVNRAPVADQTEKSWDWFPPHYEDTQIEGEAVTVIGQPGNQDSPGLAPALQAVKKISLPCKVTAPTQPSSIGISDSIGGIELPTYDYQKLFSQDQLQPAERQRVDFETNCAAAGGSSGSPVFDSKMNVIGIVHEGEPDFTADQVNPSTRVISTKSIFDKDGEQLKEIGVVPVAE